MTRQKPCDRTCEGRHVSGPSRLYVPANLRERSARMPMLSPCETVECEARGRRVSPRVMMLGSCWCRRRMTGQRARDGDIAELHNKRYKAACFALMWQTFEPAHGGNSREKCKTRSVPSGFGLAGLTAHSFSLYHPIRGYTSRQAMDWENNIFSPKLEVFEDKPCCVVCGKESKLRCSKCLAAGVDLVFCSPEHQRLARTPA